MDSSGALGVFMARLSAHKEAIADFFRQVFHVPGDTHRRSVRLCASVF